MQGTRAFSEKQLGLGPAVFHQLFNWSLKCSSVVLREGHEVGFYEASSPVTQPRRVSMKSGSTAGGGRSEAPRGDGLRCVCVREAERRVWRPPPALTLQELLLLFLCRLLEPPFLFTSPFESQLENLFPHQGCKRTHLLFLEGLEWFHLLYFDSSVSLVLFLVYVFSFIFSSPS